MFTKNWGKLGKLKAFLTATRVVVLFKTLSLYVNGLLLFDLRSWAINLRLKIAHKVKE